MVIDVGYMGTKRQIAPYVKELVLKTDAMNEHGEASEVVFINGEVKPSASKVH